MKELIIILSYCPSLEKKQVLLDFLKDLQSYRHKYDILLASHVAIDQLFFDYFDYFYFDKNNVILDDLEYRQNSWFSPFDNYVIWSSYVENGNTIGAIWDMLVPSLSLAKTLGYEKIHYFEYDSRFLSDQELNNNSKLLDEYEYIVYGSEGTHKLVGAFMSFRTNSIIDEWKILGKDVLPELFTNMYPKVPENIIFDLIKKNKKVLKKDDKILVKNGLKVSLVRGTKFYWDVPFFDPNDDKLKFISYNINQENYNTKIIINNDKYFYLSPKNEFNWDIITLSESIDKVQSLVVFRNDTKVLSLDFTHDDFKEKFIKYNSVLDNLSIKINTII